MIDIHAHILPFVDDGSKEINHSLLMIKDSVEQGITDIILTPHYRGIYKCDTNELKSSFEKFSKLVKQEGYAVNLYLGQEVFVKDNIKKLIENGTVLTLNFSKYILMEFDSDTETDITEAVYEVKRLGFIPIIAHVERYSKVTCEDVYEVKELGGYVQVNASSIVNLRNFKALQKARKLLKLGLVDFIASDVHYNRKNDMLLANQYVTKKYGEQIAERIFKQNAKEIIKG